MKNLRELKDKKVCVATSGGMDSTALLHYLKSQEKTHGYVLCAAHCEHGIRGKASVADMRFVQKLCKKWDIPLYVFRENCPKKAKKEKTSLETAARNFRYASFEQLRLEGKADCIATAHHANDEAETVLFRLSRGASLSGAAAMHAEREDIVRPFLNWSKEKIYAYVKKNKLPYRVDKSNQNIVYTRNALRLKVLPTLEQAIPGATENIARFAKRAAEDDEYLYRQSEKLLAFEDKDIIVLFSEEKPLFKRACLTAMKKLGIKRDYTQAHLNALYDLQQSERGAKLNMPLNIVAQKGENGIVFTFEKEPPRYASLQEKGFSLDGYEGGMYEVKISEQFPKMQGYEGEILRIDREKLPQDAVFRYRKDGDEITKFGGGTKKLKKFFNEKKIPVEARAYIPLIASGVGKEVYVVCGLEIADKVKVTQNTKEAVFISLWNK